MNICKEKTGEEGEEEQKREQKDDTSATVWRIEPFCPLGGTEGAENSPQRHI